MTWRAKIREDGSGYIYEGADPVETVSGFCWLCVASGLSCLGFVVGLGATVGIKALVSSLDTGNDNNIMTDTHSDAFHISPNMKMLALSTVPAFYLLKGFFAEGQAEQEEGDQRVSQTVSQRPS